MKKRIAIVLLLALAVSIAIYFVSKDAINALTKGKTNPPDISAANAIVIELNSGMVLYEKKAEEKAYPASITKILTALVALENENLDKIVKVSDSAVGVEGSSIYLEKGEKIPLRDLIYGMMLRSGNDAAVAIAADVGGSIDNFACMMNDRAKEIGAVNSHFVNPNGLQNENHYTTARDMAMIAREAMKNKEFRKIASAKSWTSDRGEGKYNYFANKNKVVYQYDGGNGIKIGYTKAAGRTLVASSKRDGMELICVVLNAPDWFNDTYKLMDYFYDKYQLVKIAEGERLINSVKIVEGTKDFAYIGTKENVVCPSLKDKECKISIAYDVQKSRKAPVSRWQKAGKLNVYCDGEYIYSEPLYYLEDIERGRNSE
ncbi:D-alanyl-D-alanine carboxypeptidase family protein [Anaerovorax odorimutans]|uniref:D-alanyl-D-alanine carboxypeptidase family protein n=1 Tax=Anaerovorax odorimutans TaxID=109327 RepID=UPI0003F6722D|nr:D-alanyl-D-alanine carboxypeptidase family protein [Anaerovorax odorimutans]